MQSTRFANRVRRKILGAAAAATTVLALDGLASVARAASVDAGKTRMKIGIVGSGNVGGTLGRVWASVGHEVMFSSRHIEHDRSLAQKIGPNARAGTPREAADFGDVLTIAVPYRSLPDVGKELAGRIDGRIVIDTCNPFPGRDGDIATWAREKGVGLASAELLPGARIVRAFNAVGAGRMGTAHERPGRIGMPIAGDDAEAIEIVSRLIRDIGFEPVLIGGIVKGRYLMPGTPLAGEHAPEDIRRIAATLE